MNSELHLISLKRIKKKMFFIFFHTLQSGHMTIERSNHISFNINIKNTLKGLEAFVISLTNWFCEFKI
jgi:uncharacterized membrane protein